MSSPFSTTKTTYQQHLKDLQKSVLSECRSLRPPPLAQYDTPFSEGLSTDHANRQTITTWLTNCLQWLDQVGGRSVLTTLNKVNEERDQVQCHQCGVCCRVASSEYTYDELRQQAQAGDVFAEQFTRVFLPYPSIKDAKKAYPQVISAMEAESGNTPSTPETSDNPLSKTLNVYHCPYVGEDNGCTLYGNPKRPALCQSYPENPLVFVYENCAWQDWKKTHHGDTVKAHAMLAICQTYTQRIQNILSIL